MLAELEFWSLANHDEDVRVKTEALYMKLMKLIRSIISKGIKENDFKQFVIYKQKYNQCDIQTKYQCDIA